MKKNKYVKRLFIVSLCIMFIMTSVMATLMAENIIHQWNCHVDNCSECLIIHFSRDLIKNISQIEINILILIIIVPMIQLINKSNEIFKKITLVDLNVIQIK